MTSDSYLTIERSGEGKFTEKMSRFLSFAIPVSDSAEARAIVKSYQNEYHDSRHVCWAYMLGPGRQEWQLNDNGEPSGTAGKPILGQINSKELTDVLVIVVRYFGGIKLGTPGLIAAYREASRLALEDAGIKVCRQMRMMKLTFGYETADKVMRIVKANSDIETIDRTFDNVCTMTLRFPLDFMEELETRFTGVGGVGVEKISC